MTLVLKGLKLTKMLVVVMGKQTRKYGIILPKGKIISKHISFKNHTIQIYGKMEILRFFYFNNAFY